MSLLIISSSLNPVSHSRFLAEEAARVLAADGTPAVMLDLRDLPLPICDGDAAYGHPNVARARDLVRAADGLLVATPVYNYDASASIKNLVELTGRAWEGKVVGFLCASGGQNSYMSIMALANSLMLDFRCVILPRFVFAVERDFGPDGITQPDVATRTAQCARHAAALAAAVRAAGPF